MKSSTFGIILTAMLIALVLVATLTFNLRLSIAANGGLVHLGTPTLFIATILFDPKKRGTRWRYLHGIISLLFVWTLWVPFTFVARGLQGYIVGKIA